MTVSECVDELDEQAPTLPDDREKKAIEQAPGASSD